MKRLFLLAILASLHVNLYAKSNKVLEAYNKASYYEQQGDVKNALLWYKQAAQEALKEEKKAPSSLLQFGKNEIESYENNSTNTTLAKIIYADFDVKAYKQNYLLPYTYDFRNKEGRNQAESKFQISFKKPLAKNLLGLDETLYLGYTQTSWWQTYEDSMPFRETNHRPELFILFPYPYEKTALKAYTIGFLHESNGRSEENSRSWNRLYLEGIFQYNGIFITPKLWYRLPEREKRDIYDAKGDDNPDIHNYLGYGDLSLSFPYKKNFFNILLRNNLRFESKNRGAISLDWTFPIPGIEDLFGYIYYFNGYGESLIDYDKKSERLGIGFSITR